MSVLIKGMEMPDSCIDCRFGKETNYAGDFEEKCLVNDKYGYVSIRKPRLETCPLVEVKEPHGDLTDKDKLMQEFMDSDLDHLQRDDWKEVIQIVSDADVVIEAEGSK